MLIRGCALPMEKNQARCTPTRRDTRERKRREPSMGQTSIEVPIDHRPAIHEIPTSSVDEPRSVTLLELIEAVSEASETEQEVLSTVTYMLNSGRVRLSGNFRDTPVEMLFG
jgi:hypothetical protein